MTAALQVASESALVLAEAGESRPGMQQVEQHEQWAVLSRMPLLVTVGVSLTRLRVRELLSLQVGQLLETERESTQDVPFTVNGVQLGWSEFEVVDGRMAVRMTRLA